MHNNLNFRLEDLPPKLKGQLNNSRKVEAEIAALKISYLKRIGRGSNIILLDSYVYTYLLHYLPWFLRKTRHLQEERKASRN
jgi:hypothetical protein